MNWPQILGFFILMVITLTSRSSLLTKSIAGLTLLIITTLAYTRYTSQRKPRRTQTIPPHKERVLILGASSGLGATLAAQYAARGASLCLVGRREDKLYAVQAECRDLVAEIFESAGPDYTGPRDVSIFTFAADITDAERMMMLVYELNERMFCCLLFLFVLILRSKRLGRA